MTSDNGRQLVRWPRFQVESGDPALLRWSVKATSFCLAFFFLLHKRQGYAITNQIPFFALRSFPSM